MSVRATRALQDKWRDERSAKQLCPSGCGHLTVQHFELNRDDPRYAPLHFHCRECDCVRVVE
jgi:hypothetical protein